MERLLEILSEIKEDVDFSTCTTLIDDGILDSFDILPIYSRRQGHNTGHILFSPGIFCKVVCE